MNRVHTLHTSDHARKAHYYVKYGGFRAHVWRDTPLPCSPVACIPHYNNYVGESLMQWQMMKNQTTYMSHQTVWTAWISADVVIMFYIAICIPCIFAICPFLWLLQYKTATSHLLFIQCNKHGGEHCRGWARFCFWNYVRMHTHLVCIPYSYTTIMCLTFWCYYISHNTGRSVMLLHST